MAHITRFGLPLAILLAAGASAITAQVPASQSANEVDPTSMSASRLAGDWRASSPSILPNATPELPQHAVDLGVVSGSTSLNRVLLLLEPSAAQRQALDTELENQQLANSSEYHRFLKPSAFAARFANSASDIAAVVDWLTSEGLQVSPLPTGRGWVEFSGTATQIEQAFNAQIHSVFTTSGTRIVITGPIAVPAALRPLVHGLVSLDGSLSTAALTPPRPVVATPESLAAETSITRAEALTPRIAAQLLHLDALHSSGSKGDGESIAIVGRSNVRTADIAAFRATFGLAAKPLSVVLDGADPGLTDDQPEAALTASWAGAAAPAAQIILVPVASTSATDGVDLSLAAIVNQSLAHTVLVGYASCEAALSESHQAFYSSLYRQAAAQGMSVIAATGDSGPAACNVAGATSAITTGYNVDALASTPWNTAVGAVALDASNALGGAPSLAAWSPQNPADPSFAGGGGRSLLYRSPTWQPLPSQPSQPDGSNSRLIPDLALPTAADTGANRGVAFCLSTATSSNGCTVVRSGGSSAAAAMFAGVAALIAEKNGMQGNLSPNLYAISRQSAVFDDVQQGSTDLACEAGSPGCDASGQIGFAATSGYDLATGLGSINAQKLVNLWATPQAAATAAATVTTLVATPATLTAGVPETFAVTVAPANAAAGASYTLTGTVSFYDGTTLLAPAVVVKANAASLANVTLSDSTPHSITAVYSGDTSWAASTSNALTLQPLLLPDSINLAVNINTTSLGQVVSLIATVTPAAIPASNVEQNPTGNVIFYNGTTILATIALVPSLNNTSTAALTTGALPAGQNVLTAVYVGDLIYMPATSSPVTIDVQDFSITPSSTNSPTNLKIIKGSSGSASYVVTGLGGFNAQIQVVCAVPTQDDMTCTASPQQVSPTGTVTFTVQTFASGGATVANQTQTLLWPRLTGGIAMAGLLFVLFPMGRRARILVGNRGANFLVLALLLAGIGVAGIGCSSSVRVTSNSGTPLGVATLTITAAAYVDNAVVSHSVYLTVNVLPPGASLNAQPNPNSK